MLLGLLSQANLDEARTGGNPTRRRLTSPQKSELRNQPADLYQTQLFSQQIRDSIA